jgi:hypothetical protein
MQLTYDDIGVTGNILDALGSVPSEIAGDVILCKMDIIDHYNKYKEFKKEIVSKYAIRDEKGIYKMKHNDGTGQDEIDFGENKKDVDDVWEKFLKKKVDVKITSSIPTSKLAAGLAKIGVPPNQLEPLFGIFINK